MQTHFEIVRRHPLIGAEVRGVDLARPIDDATIAAINQAWLENMVLVFPDQAISDEQDRVRAPLR